MSIMVVFPAPEGPTKATEVPIGISKLISEIAALAKLAQEKVKATFNIALEPEVNLVGLNLL